MAYSESIIFDDVPGPVSAVTAVVIDIVAPKVGVNHGLVVLNRHKPFVVIEPPDNTRTKEN